MKRRRAATMKSRLVGGALFSRHMVLLTMTAELLTIVGDAFLVVSSWNPVGSSTSPGTCPPFPAAKPGATRIVSVAMGTALSMSRSAGTSTTTAAVSPEVALDPIISDLRARIRGAPSLLEGNEEARLHAEATLSTTFRVDDEGNLIGGFDQQVRLARALALNAFVVVRVQQGDARVCLDRLGGAAEYLLGETRTVEEKMEDYGQMKDYEEGVVSGYAGGGGYGSDQFLETRGSGGGQIVPEISCDVAPDVIEGRRVLAAISRGVLQAVVHQSLPEIDPAAFVDLVDGGEGHEGAQGPRKMSSTPLRMCRYAGGADGVAFGAHTDTTFLTVIPCASAPGLEILQPSTGRWVRPEAARNCRAGSDVMLLAGELLQVFGRGRYQAAVHRVVRPAGLVKPRVSTPLLVRGAAGVTIRDSMLPSEIITKLREKHLYGEGTRPLGAGAGAGARWEGTAAPLSSSTQTLKDGYLTMTDLWAALQFKTSDSSSAHVAGGDADVADATGDDDGGDDGDLENRRGGGGGGGRFAVGREKRGPYSDKDDGASSSAPRPLASPRTEGQIHRHFAPFAPGGVTVLSADPLLVRLHGFASPEDCAAIIARSSGTLVESTTWGGSDAQTEADQVRISATTWLKDGVLAPLLKNLTDRVSGMSGLPSTFMESWQVARYKPQGCFKLHTDHVEAFNELACGGRLGTLIVYLNDEFTGGQTDFPFLETTVEPSTGDAIYFHSVVLPVEQEDADSMQVDERVAHAGLAVEEGNKWIATKWLHPLPFPHGPNGNERDEADKADEAEEREKEEGETGGQRSTKQLSRVR